MYIRYSTFKKAGVRTFRAPNPWNNGQVCDWSLDRYGYFASISVEKVTEAPPQERLNRINAKSLGIQALPTGRYHILPRSLEELLREQQAADEQLPALLHQMEPHLEDLDFALPNDALFVFYACFCALLLLGSCSFLASDPSDWKLALGFIAFCAFFTTFSVGRLVRIRQRKDRQKMALGVSSH